MPSSAPTILTLNAGSSSIRFGIYAADKTPELLHKGKIDRLTADHSSAVDSFLNQLEKQPGFEKLSAVGHRVVHGMNHSEPEIVTAKLLTELRHIRSYDPDHLPRELALIELVRRRYPQLTHVACFDTAFHHAMPTISKLLPIPRRYFEKGIMRYGFHGLSYAYLMEELGHVDPKAAKGRTILAHLGSGASIAAVYQRRSIDTSMSFTPTAGLMMGSRSGDLDPSLISYLAKTERMTPAKFQNMVNRESGLLGVSETSADIRDLLARETTDPHAREAIDMFCYQAKKWIGAFAAALGGVDTLIFAAGIGENSPAIRKRICAGLGFLGITLDTRRNSRNAPMISADSGRVRVRVIRTDEELMIARSVHRILNL
jgi:acetate kinase